MSESEFEAELRAHRPAPASPALELAIARDLEAAPRTVAIRPASGIIVRPEKRSRFFLGGLAWAFGGAALAALAILTAPPSWVGRGAAGGKSGTPVQAEETAYFEPLESAREVVSAETSDIFYDADEGPSQVVRYSSVERHSWTNPTTGAVVEVEVPREDFFLVPVAYQ
jgi:hypothetical protein